MRANQILNETLELDALKRLSLTLGANPLWVQACSGNTSVKLNDVLWIKASGKWLVRPYADGFLVPVKLSRARRCVEENTAIPETVTPAPGTTCASVETALHAVLPHNVIAHIHSVNVIAWAVREDAPSQLGSLLAGLPWRWIPYSPSGMALAHQAQRALLATTQPDVLVLGNHGLVVCGDSCHAVEQLLAEVERRLALEPRPYPEPRLSLLKQSLPATEWRLPAAAGVHALATDETCQSILQGGMLYPCQAIFLPSLRADMPLRAPAVQPVFRLIGDHGVLCHQHITQAESEMLAGLADVVRRIDRSAPLRYLTAAELHAVSSSEADAYRRGASEHSDHLEKATVSV